MSDIIDENILDIWTYAVAMYSMLADVSNLKEGEIVGLNPKNPVAMKDIEQWDKVLEPKEPEQNDLGIDKDRKLYWYRWNKWTHINP